MSQSTRSKLGELLVQFEQDIHREVRRHGPSPFGDWGPVADLSVQGYRTIILKRVRSCYLMLCSMCGLEHGYYVFRKFLYTNQTLKQIDKLLKEPTVDTAQPKPIDDLEGYTLSEQGAELMRYALSHMDQGFDLPLSWWQDHIVPTPDEKIHRALEVVGPVVSAHELDVFDSWKTVCRNTHAYAQAAYKGLQDIMTMAEALLLALPPTSPVLSFAELKQRKILSVYALHFLAHTQFLRTIGQLHTDTIQVGLRVGVRAWYFNLSNRSLSDSFNLWLDVTVGSLTQQQIVILVSHYLATKNSGGDE